MPLSVTLPKPYIPITLDELCQVKSIKHWTNTNVRILGKVRLVILEKSLLLLEALGEDNSTIDRINVDYRQVISKLGILKFF